LICLNHLKLQDNFWQKKFNYIVRWIWIKENNIAYVKDEGANLNAMIVAQKFVVSCEILDLDESFLIHAMSMHFLKHANIGTLEKKVCQNIKCLSINVAQSDI